MNVSEYLLAGKDESRPALLTLEATYSYSDLRRAACAVAHFVTRAGGRKGDRVLLISDTGFFWVAAYLGILRTGLVCVPLPTKTPAAELAYIVRSTEARFVFAESRIAQKLAPVFADLTVVCAGTANLPLPPGSTDFDELQRDSPEGEFQPVALHPDDLAALMFTSGSTGKPRGVMVAARNIVANTDSIIEYLSLTDADRIMSVLPFHYCFGTSLLHTHLRVGGSIVVEPRFMYPDAVLRRLVETECTGFAGVPSHYQMLLRRSSLAKMHFPRLRYVQQAGGHLAPSFVRELRHALPGTQVFVMYGQTEATARLAYLPPEFLESKRGSIGIPIPGVNLSVLDESGKPVEPGKVGQIVAEGDNVTLGYWNDPTETNNVFIDGKLHTGDLATVDQDGFIYIVDRAKDFLKCGGQRVSCRYLEDVLLECGMLVEAAVIGIPDAVLGEAACAYVVPRERKPDSISEQVHEFCRAHLQPTLVPKEVVVLDALPKNSSGKVLKQALRQQHA